MQLPASIRYLLMSAVVAASWTQLAHAEKGSQSPAVIQRISFDTAKETDLRIALSEPRTPSTMLLSGPDRLVIDFPNATAGRDLRKAAFGNAQVKSVRVGLFQSNPPVLRIVVDLKAHQKYELQPSGNMLLVKLGASADLAPSVKQPRPMPANMKAASTAKSVSPVPQPAPRFAVQSGLGGSLTIHARNATLAEVLFEVQQRTGADIPIPAGAELEHVTADYGPGPARETLSALLNGSHFNFVMVGSEGDPGKLRSVILTPKFGEPANPVAAASSAVPVAAPVQEYPEPEVIQIAPEPDPATVELQPDGAGAPPVEPPPLPPEAGGPPQGEPQQGGPPQVGPPQAEPNLQPQE